MLELMVPGVPTTSGDEPLGAFSESAKVQK